MFNKLFITLMTATCFNLTALNAEIVEINHIEEILPAIDQDTFVLFNIADVLTDSELSLGSQPWRKYILEQTGSQTIHDHLSWMVFNDIPHKPVEPQTPELISDLQQGGIAVAGLTSRGRQQWYSTPIYAVDIQTEKLLASININFAKSNLPFVYIQMEENPFMSHYRRGIYYVNHMGKGEFLKDLLFNSGYKPSSVVLVDDKRESLEDVETAMQELGIPFQGFWYTRTKQDRKNFSPMVANVQLLIYLIGKCSSPNDDTKFFLPDEKAQKIFEKEFSGVVSHASFLELIIGGRDLTTEPYQKP